MICLALIYLNSFLYVNIFCYKYNEVLKSKYLLKLLKSIYWQHNSEQKTKEHIKTEVELNLKDSPYVAK